MAKSVLQRQLKRFSNIQSESNFKPVHGSRLKGYENRFQLQAVEQTHVRILRGLDRTKRIGPMQIHRRCFQRGGDQKVDEIFSGNLA